MSPAPFALPEGWRYLRCDLCGERIGMEPKTNNTRELREKGILSCQCFACAAVEAAEAITKQAAGDDGA